MEMHQVRYFLAVAQALNFTRAAEECHVAQPSLTRAIKLLEDELGGDLFRRERPRAMLTPLGERMFPLLRQCYDAAQSARALAARITEGEVAVLKIAVSSSIELGLIMAQVGELRKSFSEIELKILRGTGGQVIEHLKAGEVELAIAAEVDAAWDRLDTWRLFEESFDVVFSRGHRLANQETVAFDELEPERLLSRTHCERYADLSELLRARGFAADRRHEVASDQDLLALLDANIGVGFLPRSVNAPPSLVRMPVAGFDFRRTVCVYGVAGRQRTAATSMLLKLLRAANWPRRID
jgi:DNA-binding transcriptional LysR family regulator